MDYTSKIFQLFIKSKIDYEISYKDNICEIKINDNYIIQSETFCKKKEALNSACNKIYNLLPAFIYSQVISTEGSLFRAIVKSESETFKSKLYTKKRDAVSEILKTVVLLHLGKCNCNPKPNIQNNNNNTKERINDIREWQANNIKTIKEKLKIKNIDDNLLTLAFIHSSFSHNYEEQIKQLLKTNECNYEKLEFLGDLMLQFVVTNCIYNKFPNESILSQTRAKLVCKNACVKYMKFLELDGYILCNNYKATLNIIGDVFESVIGAIYLTNRKIKSVKILVENLIPIIDVSEYKV